MKSGRLNLSMNMKITEKKTIYGIDDTLI